MRVLEVPWGYPRDNFSTSFVVLGRSSRESFLPEGSQYVKTVRSVNSKATSRKEGMKCFVLGDGLTTYLSRISIQSGYGCGVDESSEV